MNNQKYIPEASKGHYLSRCYLTEERWDSYSYIIKKIIKLNPAKILEIGPGAKVMTNILKTLNYFVETLDLNEELEPDYVLDITNKKVLKLKGKFDLILAAQVFEHIEYDDFIKSLEMLKRISKSYFIITLPSTRQNSFHFSIRLKISLLREIKIIRKIYFKKVKELSNPQHYWEIGEVGFPLGKIKRQIRMSGWRIVEETLIPENPYHHFFLLENEEREI